MQINLTWGQLKVRIDNKGKIRYNDRDSLYLIYYTDYADTFQCSILKDGGADQIEFEADYKDFANSPQPNDVATQMEKNDKTLKTAFAYGITDENGIVEAKYPIPADGRYLAYGDAEFEVRHFFDRIIGIYLRDDDQLIAWMVALMMDPGATEPVADAVVQSLEGLPGGPFPRYPILGSYEDNEINDGPPLYAGGPPKWGAGMSMTFMYGNTEVGPVGGYAFVEGDFYFVIRAKKGERCLGSKAGIAFAVSIDGAKKDPLS